MQVKIRHAQRELLAPRSRRPRPRPS
jgi:hypothetical protein